MFISGHLRRGLMDQRRQRRSWSDEEKRLIVAEARADGAAVAEGARRHGANANMIFKWLRDPRLADDGEAVEFLPVEMRAPGDVPVIEDLAVGRGQRPALPSPPRLEERPGIIEIDLACGARVRLDAHVNDRALARVLRILRGAG